MYMKTIRRHRRQYFSVDPIALAYSGQYGGATLPFYMGKQYGMGWLRTLARFVFPIAKRALGIAGNVAANTAQDVIQERKGFKQSLRDNTMTEASRLLASGVKRAATQQSPSINRYKKIKKHHTIFGRKH